MIPHRLLIVATASLAFTSCKAETEKPQGTTTTPPQSEAVGGPAQDPYSTPGAPNADAVKIIKGSVEALQKYQIFVNALSNDTSGNDQTRIYLFNGQLTTLASEVLALESLEQMLSITANESKAKALVSNYYMSVAVTLTNLKPFIPQLRGEVPGVNAVSLVPETSSALDRMQRGFISLEQFIWNRAESLAPTVVEGWVSQGAAKKPANP